MQQRLIKMKKIVKLSVIVVAMILSANSFASAELAGAVTLKPNKDGYKLKFVANVSGLPIIGDKWYPSFYNYNSYKKVMEADDNYIGAGGGDVVVNNNIVYRLQTFYMFDKYTKKINSQETQLRLCKLPIGTSQWDCSNTLDFSSSGRSYTPSLFNGDDGDTMAGDYSDHDGKSTAFIYNNKTNQVIKVALDGVPNQNNELSGVLHSGYYKDSRIYSSLGMIDLINKTFSIHNTAIFAINYSCRADSNLIYGAVYSQGKIYTISNQRFYNINGTFQSDYFLGSQIGELNIDVNHGLTLGLASSIENKDIQMSGNNIYLLGSVTSEFGKDPKFKVYYLPNTADKNQTWNELSLKVNGKNWDFYSVGMGGARLINNQKKLYLINVLSKKTHIMGRGNYSLYLYEVSK